MVVPARMLAAATLATTVLCLILAVVQVSHLPATRTEALDLGYQYVDPQAQLGVTTHPVQLPQYSAVGTNHAFLGQYDGDGQSTSDVAREEQLAQRTVAMAKHVKKAKKAHKPWKPMAANQLFKFKGVHFKGFNKQKAAMYQKMRQAHKLQPSHTQMKSPRRRTSPRGSGQSRRSQAPTVLSKPSLTWACRRRAQCSRTICRWVLWAPTTSSWDPTRAATLASPTPVGIEADESGGERG